MISYIFAVSLHSFWCQKFAIDMEMKLTGIAIACCITNAINFGLLTFLFWSTKEMREAFTLPNKSSFTNLWEYTKIGLPFSFM